MFGLHSLPEGTDRASEINLSQHEVSRETSFSWHDCGPFPCDWPMHRFPTVCEREHALQLAEGFRVQLRSAGLCKGSMEKVRQPIESATMGSC